MNCGSMVKDSSTLIVSDAASGVASASGAVVEVATIASPSSPVVLVSASISFFSLLRENCLSASSSKQTS